MPPEPLPWDRKDFFTERKHERSESLGSVVRWRESSSHHGGSRGFTRWGSGDFCRPPGHGKQGSWHIFPDESSNGYAPSRPAEKLSDDDNSRRPVSRGEGKYNRSYRESRGSFGQREWKGTLAWETSNGFLHTTGRPTDPSNSQRSVDMIMYTSPPHSEPGVLLNCSQLHSKEQHDKINDVNGLSTGQKFDGENSLGSLDWKPLKWSRSGSLSSRGSGLSNSSSSKSIGGVDSNEANDGTVAVNVAMLESPSGDATQYDTTATPFEDMASRKKPRLGWGEGLAKYEKKKVDDPEESASKSGAEPTQSLCLSGTEKSRRFASFSDCASPATPSSVACSSSPGIEEKSFVKAMDVDSEVNNLCESVGPGPQNQQEGLSFNLEKSDVKSLGTLGYSLSEFLQSDDASSVDSSFARSTAVNKLLLLKDDVLKTIEVTESEIDSLENELKALTSVARSSCPCTASSSSMPVETRGKSCEGQDYASSISRPSPLQIASFGDIGEGEAHLHNGQLAEIHANDKDDDVDSPGSATSKFVEPITLVKSAPSADVVCQCQSPYNFDVSRAMETPLNQSVVDALANRAGVIACSDNAFALECKSDILVNDGNASRCNMLCHLILASNKEATKEASDDAFNPLLPSTHCNIDIARVNDVACRENDMSILEKFARRKRFEKFKESVTTLQFRALHHLWKEDLRLLSLRKSRAKSHKKFEPSLRITVNGYQKHRSAARSRFSSPVRNFSLVPKKEMTTYTSKLLSDSRMQRFRESLKMPALILDEREKTASRFVSTNRLVEDPCAFDKERTMINPWTIEERETFLDKFATFGKDFTKVASFLNHKTTADCVEFYYKNHKSDLFEKTKKKKLDFGKNGKPVSTNTYLVASRKKWDCGISTVSLDVLGDASLLAAQGDGDMLEEQMFSRRFSLGGGGGRNNNNNSKTVGRRNSSIILDKTSSYNLLETETETERETVAADVLAGSFSSEAMSSCITSSMDHPVEGHQAAAAAATKEQPPLTPPDVMENLEDETCSGESCGEMEDPADWTDEEKSAFMEAVSSYGKDFSMISRHVRTRSVGQCKVFFGKARKCLGLDAVVQSRRTETGGCIGSPPGTDDTTGGDDSDAEEDACAVVVRRDEEDLPCSVIKKADSDSCGTFKSMDLENDGNGEEGTVRTGGPKTSDDHPVVERKKDGPEAICGRGDDPLSEPMRPPRKESAYLVEEEEEEGPIRESCSISVVANAVVVSDGQSSRKEDHVQPPEKREADAKKKKQPPREEECSTSSYTATDSTLLLTTTGPAGFSFNLEPKERLSLDSDRSCVQQRARSLPPDSAIDRFEKSNDVLRDRFSSVKVVDAEKHNNSHVVNQDEGGCRRRHLSGNTFSDLKSVQILRGYPIQMPKEVNGGSSSDRSRREMIHQSLLSRAEAEGRISSGFNSPCMPTQQQDLYLLKCSSSAQEMNNPLVKQNSSCSAETERQQKSGTATAGVDFKLFGQKILSNAPPPPAALHQQKDEKGEGVGLIPSSSSSSLVTVMKPTNRLLLHGTSTSSSHAVDGSCLASAGLLNFERTTGATNGVVGSRSYGFWDGSKIQTTTGFSTLPDSALLLAKYPAAFSNYSPVVPLTTTTTKSGPAALFPSTSTAASSSSGVVDYQMMYRNRDGVKLLLLQQQQQQPFTLEVKQQQQQQLRSQDAASYHHHYTEMPRCNGLDALSSSLQQLVGRGGGVLVGGGGSCNVVSDPVAAIKMHYAQTEQQQLAGGQSGSNSIIREEETSSWRER